MPSPRQLSGKQSLTQADNLYEVCSLLPSDLSQVIHHLALPCTYTPILCFLEDDVFFSASRPLHMLFPLARRFSLCPSTLFHCYFFTHLHLNIISSEESFLTPRLDLGIIWFSQYYTSFFSENESQFVIMHLLISVSKSHKGRDLIF